MGTKHQGSFLLVLVGAVLVQQAAAYITYTNGSELNIEARWPPAGGPCCYNIPAGNMSSVDSYYAVYTEPNCKLGTKTCKWPAIVKSIWVCGCEGQTPLQMPDNAWTGCCGRVVIKETDPLGNTTRNPLKTNCSAYNDRGVYHGLGVISSMTCHYDPSSGFMTGLSTTYGYPGSRRYTQLRGGAWGAMNTTIAIPADDKIWQLGVRVDPRSGGIKYMRFATRLNKTFVCGDWRSTLPIKWVNMPSAYRKQNTGLKLDALWYKYREFIGSWKGTVCMQRGRQILGTLSPIWARDSTYYSYPGIHNGVGYINPDVTVTPMVAPPLGKTLGRYWMALPGLWPNGLLNLTDPKPIFAPSG